MRSARTLPAAVVSSMLALGSLASAAEKQGGVLRVYHRDSPATASIHEEATNSANIPFMAVFNNLVIYKQDVAQNSIDTIIPDLASSWAWSSDNKTLSFKLREGVKWHDGKPFTSSDVKCTFDMVMGQSSQKFRKNSRKAWYNEVVEVTTNGDLEVLFKLKRPQPALLEQVPRKASRRGFSWRPKADSIFATGSGGWDGQAVQHGFASRVDFPASSRA